MNELGGAFDSAMPRSRLQPSAHSDSRLRGAGECVDGRR